MDKLFRIPMQFFAENPAPAPEAGTEPTEPAPDPKPAEPTTAPEPAPAPQPEPTPEPAAPPQPDNTAELQSLRSELAKAKLERTAALEAAQLGIDPKHIGYVLRLAELPEKGDEAGIRDAIQKVLDDVPAFRMSTSGAAAGIRIGGKEPKQQTESEDIARAFGNAKTK